MAVAAVAGSRGNFVRLGIAIIDEETSMLRKILEDEVPPCDIEQKAVKKMRGMKLSDKQKDTIKRASTTSNYSELDISLLYTLIRNICSKIQQPTNSWGGDTMPDIAHITLGDDIERIRLMRNEIYGHVADTWMSDLDFQNHWQIIKDICVRMDTYFSSKNKRTEYEKNIDRIQTMALDDNAEQEYVNKIKDMEEKERKLEEKIVKLKEHIALSFARGDKTHKTYISVSLSNSTERGISIKRSDTFLQDLGCIINGIERFIQKESAIEEASQMYQSLLTEGIAEIKRNFHNDLNRLRNFIQESTKLFCPLKSDQEINLLISIFDFVMFLKKYECKLKCFFGSLFLCFEFPAKQPPDNQTRKEIENALRTIILQDEHLSLYGLPCANSLNLVIDDVEETAFTEQQRRRGQKRKAESDEEDEEEMSEEDIENYQSGNNEIPMEMERKMGNIDILSDEENDEMDTTAKAGLKLRLFQEELTEMAKRGRNTIVCSETGTGKTRIAFAIIKDHLQKNPEGRVGVLANNAVLVAQHYKVLTKLLPEYEDSAMKLSGSSNHSKNLNLFAKCVSIIIMTPALILNTIESGNDPQILSDFTLLVFDECHHTYGEHIFNKVMRRYHMEKDKGYSVPQILGLTATLGTGAANTLEKAKSHILRIMANLDVGELSVVTKQKDDYEKFLKTVKTEIIQLQKQPTKDAVGEVIETFMASLEKRIHTLKDRLSESDDDEDALRDVIFGIPDDKRSSKYITWCAKLKDKAYPLMGKNLPLSTEIKLYARYLKIFSETLEINECIRGESAVLALQEKLDGDNLGKPSLNPLESDLAKLTENMMGKMRERFVLQSKDRHIDKLLEILQQHIKQDSVIIIFVKTRELVFWLEKFLKQENYNFGRLTGQQSGDGAPAMSQKQQDDVIKKLNAGELQGIIATDIAGEGLNIDNCSGAIRYMCVGNEITSRQFKGRIRKDEGLYTTLGEVQHTIREHLNTQRALLMTEAVNDICHMCKQELKENLDKYRRDILLEEKRKQQKEKEDSLTQKHHSEYAVSCTRCGKFDIDCENIFLIRGIHHAVVDKNISAKITQKSLKNKPYNADGLEQLKEWYHDNCPEKLGTVYLYKGVRLPVMGQDRFVYYRKEDQPRKPKPVVKWKVVPFEKSLREVDEEQLTEMSGVL